MATTQDRQLVEQWRSIQNSYFRTAAAIDRALEAKFDIGLNEFEILDLVAESVDSACRMKALGERTPMTQSAVSKVVDRLEKAGLVSRVTCADDRRSLYLELTDAGRTLHSDAAVEHRALLKANLGE
ncbi:MULTISPECIES: MarR family winged helix-turn-helix transcriptional regulator [Arthrobacter]|uniref:DNA-binding MarR family transcriptional regulator n=1 Tax=Arthrobacter bambusae TaxID=1338426 RepID=A0AAW8DM16_9MICC|nr:MarR family transcriptional regulator [Arthrobacter bambusae]MDP9906723.1 DNA-binding MarR family transcriptional regulator [Arthrobacter bambusae]MDQ0130980.1 DNA-binding MarR family transcriptional regulator [Arthrobacter bambusae]MDQ0182502.1 DNA-binding MarR family transcriptional regulator [Arthrobacter bambusae]